jgi:hypothetical protein
MHRPISVTHSIPKTVTDDAFASIFAPSVRGLKIPDVISTLSSTVDQLEQPMAKMTLNGQHGESEDGSTRIDIRHPDGSESAVYVQLSAMSGQFLPFRPPPLPASESENPSSSSGAVAAQETAETAVEPSHRVYKAILTIEETTDADGQVRVLAHSPQLIEEGEEAETLAPRSFLERMALRQLRFDEASATQAQQRRLDRGDAARTMLAISVKRQKKLKMKKKKYKKLMRKTRNLRRKLDRT